MTVEAALAAMDAAEQEARDHLAYKDRELEYGVGLYVEDWARDRLRLIARDRATLERHRAYADRFGRSVLHYCRGCRDMWPCATAREVADYWQEDA